MNSELIKNRYFGSFTFDSFGPDTVSGSVLECAEEKNEGMNIQSPPLAVSFSNMVSRLTSPSPSPSPFPSPKVCGPSC